MYAAPVKAAYVASEPVMLVTFPSDEFVVVSKTIGNLGGKAGGGSRGGGGGAGNGAVALHHHGYTVGGAAGSGGDGGGNDGGGDMRVKAIARKPC